MTLLNQIRLFFGLWPKFKVSKNRKNEILNALDNSKPGSFIEVSGDEMDWLTFTKNGTLQMPEEKP